MQDRVSKKSTEVPTNRRESNGRKQEEMSWREGLGGVEIYDRNHSHCLGSNVVGSGVIFQVDT